MYKDVIGIVGGMGSVATLYCFERLLELIPIEKEWDRPRIIIDNRCTMPSRVRALLYAENRNQLIQELTDSIRWLSDGGATRILLCCNTSHAFLNDIFQVYPEGKTRLLNLIEITCNEIHKKNISKVFVLATEGTYETKLYQEALIRYNIDLEIPDKKRWPLIRQSIEEVKRSSVCQETVDRLVPLVESTDCDAVLLGCTELSTIYFKILNQLKNNKILFDPLHIALQCIVNKLK